MSYAETLAATLKAAAQETYKATFEAGSSFGRAHGALRNAEDLVDVLARAIDLTVAVEALHNEADLAVKHLRAALAEAMGNSGAASIHGAHHTAYLSKRPAFVSIDQEDLIPAEFTTTKTVVDKRAIASAIKDGVAVAGASLLTPNEPVLVIRSRKEA
jgi:hypothetical protein